MTKSSRLSVADLPTHLQAEAALQLRPAGSAGPARASGAIKAAARISPSTDESRLNRTERAYLEQLRGSGVPWIGVQNLTLKIGDDTRYTPDFFVVDDAGIVTAVEVKGFWRDDARVKIKVAARAFPWIRFVAVQAIKGGGWSFEAIKP